MTKKKMKRSRAEFDPANLYHERLAEIERADLAASAAAAAMSTLAIDRQTSERVGGLQVDVAHTRLSSVTDADAIARRRAVALDAERQVKVLRDEAERLTRRRNTIRRLAEAGRELAQRLGVPNETPMVSAEERAEILAEERARAEKFIRGPAPWSTKSPDLYPRESETGVTPAA